MISKSSRFGVGSLIRDMGLARASNAVSGDLRHLFTTAAIPAPNHRQCQHVSRENHTAEQAFHHLRQGLEKGLAYYYQTYDTALVYFALRITGDEAAAEDIVAEAFVKLWEARENMTHPGAVKAYLYQVVRNAAVDWLRRQKRERAHVQAAVRLQAITESEMDRLEITAETHRTIYTSIENLPPKCGVVFRKFYLEGKSLPQIARELGVSVNTVRNQKVQALAILRKALTVVAWLVSLLRF